MDNKWELYSSMSGWQKIVKRLDSATESALAAADKQIASGSSVVVAASKAYVRVAKIMEKPACIEFGAADTEPRMYLAAKIQRHMRDKHKVHLEVSRWGDVERVG